MGAAACFPEKGRSGQPEPGLKAFFRADIKTPFSSRAYCAGRQKPVGGLGVKPEANALYEEAAQYINRVLGRRAVSVRRIHRVIEQAKQVRRSGGAFALLHYSTELVHRLFAPDEVEKLKGSSRYGELARRLIDLMVEERVITRREAMMLKRAVR